MSRDRKWVVEIVTSVTGSKATAEMVVDRLMEEGLLHMGYGDADIDKVVEAFTDTFGTTKVSRQDRFAANRLVKKYGSQSVVGIIRLLGSLNAEKFAPIVNSVADLESKWVSVVNFLRKQKGDETIDV